MKVKNKNLKSGFTLLELLVVVLIIGIFAGIALPQYQMAVEKSRSAEVLMNIATIKREIGLYITANGLPSSYIYIFYDDFATVELSGGEWNNHNYITKNFYYSSLYISENGGELQVDSNTSGYTLYCTQYENYYNDDSPMGDGWYCSCITQLEDSGRKICKAVYEPLGFKYVDGEL